MAITERVKRKYCNTFFYYYNRFDKKNLVNSVTYATLYLCVNFKQIFETFQSKVIANSPEKH